MDETQSSRERLINAAGPLMYSRGYEAVSVADVCKAAEVQKGSFYHFFASKQALAVELVDRSWQIMRSTVYACSLDDPTQGGLEAIDTYGNLLADGLEQMQADQDAVVGCFFGNLAVELSTRDEVIRTRIAEVFDEMASSAARATRRAVELEEIVSTTDVKQTAAEVIALVEGLMVLAKARRDPSILRQLGPTTRRLLT